LLLVGAVAAVSAWPSFEWRAPACASLSATASMEHLCYCLHQLHLGAVLVYDHTPFDESMGDMHLVAGREMSVVKAAADRAAGIEEPGEA
jgi:hypothetical protein